MDAPQLARPWRVLRTRWPWLCLAYLGWQVVAGWVTLLVGATVVLIPAWARAYAALERRMVRLAGHAGIPAPTRRGATAWRESAYLAVTVLVALAGTIGVAGVTALLLPTLFAPLWGRTVPIRLGRVGVDTGAEYAAVVVGLVLLALVLWVATAAAVGLSRLSGIVLGPDTDDLQRRVEALGERTVRVQDELALERRELERRLHDGAQVHLGAAAARLGLLELDLAALPADQREPLMETLGSVRDQLEATGDAIRRVAHGLVPQALSDQGLAGAIAALAADLPLDVEHFCDLPRLPPAVEASAYLVVAEAVTNVLKHADARHLTIEGRLDDGGIVLRVADDGRGGADPAGGGVLGMEARARSLGGRLSFSSPEGGPTTIRLWLPGSLVP